ncbi:MAG: extracellular solute-binding protein [Solobacterium sp.]|nr:extracellular solute-binding protein [Solobacterium sp.]
MRKKLLCLSAAVLLLCGCHGSRGMTAFAVPESFDESRDYEITFWAKNDTNKVQTAIYTQAIKDFEELYPNIKVNMRLYTDYGRIYNDVITNIATNTTPNVCITYPDHIATYMTGTNVVVPLDEIFDDERYGLGGTELKYDGPAKDEIIPQFLAECRIGEHWYAVPYMRSTEAVYINRTFVEALGYEVPEVLTWDWMFEVGDAAMAMNEEGNYLLNNQKVMIPIIYKSTDNMMIQMLKQLDAGYSDEDGTIGIFNDTTKDLLYMVRDHALTGAFSTFKISSYPGNFLNAGQCLFAIDSTAGATWLGPDAPLMDIHPTKVVRFDIDVRMVPQFDPEHPQMISQGPSLCIFNKQDPQEVLAAWLFTQYLITNDVQIAYAETEGYVPVTSKAQNTAEYQDYLSREGEDNNEHYFVKIQASRLLLEHPDYTFVTPVFNGSASLRDAAGQLIENVVKAVRRKQTVDDAWMEQNFKDVNALYRLDQRGTSPADREDLGPLPAGSKALLGTLAAVWVLILIYLALQKMKQRT